MEHGRAPFAGLRVGRRWIGWGACRARSNQQAATLWATFDAWLRRAAAVVADSAAALDAMNVYPVRTPTPGPTSG